MLSRLHDIDPQTYQSLLTGWQTNNDRILQQQLLAVDPNRPDALAQMHECVKRRPVPMQYASSAVRAQRRVAEITSLIPPTLQVQSILDIGCADGSITAQLAAAFPDAAVLGVDVEHSTYSAGRDRDASSYTFSVFDGTHLSMCDDDSVDLVALSMVLHHVENLDPLLTEISRVVRPGGAVVLREHDCRDDPTAAKLDAVHALYARVWFVPPEDPAFPKGFYANYRPRDEWKRLLSAHGLMPTTSTPTKGQQHAYTEVFCKPPRPWRVHTSQRTGNPYCFNPTTGESTYEFADCLIVSRMGK